MTIKQKLKTGVLEAGFIGASTIGGTELATAAHTGLPLFILIPIGVAGGVIGARQLVKEMREESEKKHKKLKKVI
jgi:hypothetical protein